MPEQRSQADIRAARNVAHRCIRTVFRNHVASDGEEVAVVLFCVSSHDMP
jgi:hypothetical protein